ncbi:MAG: CotS family spore coat protein [Eubacteriales bacterium]|nr:CotS family spore coat protein [Eubacteriales bacterium]
MGDLIGEIIDRYNIRVKNFDNHMEGSVLLSDEDERYLVRETGLPAERILFMHHAKEHLASNGFDFTDRFACTVEEEPFFVYRGKIYTVSRMCEGRECDFLELQDVISAVGLLAKLHLASKGFELPFQSTERSQLGKLPDLYRKRAKELSKLKNYALRGKGEFDHIFLENVDFYSNLGNEAARKLETSAYNDLCEDTARQRTFCHHDYCHRNVICGKDRMYVKGFDYCCAEIWVKDIADLLRRHLRNCSWPIDNAKIILEAYASVRTPADEELEVLKIMLSFPYKFWSVANKFYNSKRCWAEKTFVPKIKDIVGDKSNYVKFLNSLGEL